MVTADQARALLARGRRLRSQPPEDWAGDFPLPPAVADFYRDVGPSNATIDVGFNPVFLPSLKRLWKHQDGYRHHGSARAKRGEPSWNDDWLVVGDRGADPLIFSRATGTILIAEHGEGDWDPVPLFPDLNAMAACLAILGESDDDDHGTTVREGLTTLLGSADEADRVLSRLDPSLD